MVIIVAEDDIQEEINFKTNEIGYIARLIDKELTIYARMKINKGTLIRIGEALLIYIVTMSLFAVLL